VGQTVHPVGFSLGVYRDWFARWFTRDSYGKQIIEDLIIRRFINAFLNKADIARVK
jgi:small subunit ribosomal protein S3